MGDDRALPDDGWLLRLTGGRVSPPSNFHPLVDAWADIEAREREANIPFGTPVLVRPEGDLDFRLVEYFTRSLDFTGLAVSSQATYARQMKIWFDFVRDFEGSDWDEAGPETFLAFRAHRMFTGDHQDRVSPATFGNSLPPLRVFYDWAKDQGYVQESPIPKATSKRSSGGKPKNSRTSRERWVLPRTYAMWRNVGLLDCQATADSDTMEVRPAKERSVGARGRNQTRNVAYTDLLLTSALRNRELSHLLLSELPASASEEAMLASTVAKGGRERAWTTLSPHPLLSVDRYVRTVRRAQVRTARARGIYDAPHWIVCSLEDGGASILLRGGERREVESLTVQERPRLLAETNDGVEPLMVWLNETGTPMDARSWGNVFTKGNNRVASEYARLGIRSRSPRISAHSLRFTCALFTLLAYVQTIDEQLGVSPLDPWVESRYTEAFAFVQEFLGHADEETTKSVYLKPLRSLRRANALGTDRTLPSLMDWLAHESDLVADPKVEW